MFTDSGNRLLNMSKETAFTVEQGCLNIVGKSDAVYMPSCMMYYNDGHKLVNKAT